MFPGIYILFSLSVSSEKRTMKTDDGRDVKDSTLLSERMVSVIEAPDYLASFHIDTSGEAGNCFVTSPKYIVVFCLQTDLIFCPLTSPYYKYMSSIGYVVSKYMSLLIFPS